MDSHIGVARDGQELPIADLRSARFVHLVNETIDCSVALRRQLASTVLIGRGAISCSRVPYRLPYPYVRALEAFGAGTAIPRILL